MFSFLRKKDHTTDIATEADPLNISPTVDMASSEESNLFGRLKQRLSRSSSKLTEGFASLILGKKTIDDNLLEEL
jgi:fused signal recognition particle receptor